jgi:coenzyme F420-reducing hydrogenase beta subunit
MAQSRKKFSDLENDVVETGKCVSCGTCVAVCPVNVIDLEEGLPKLVGKCIECGICYGNCPRTDFSVEDLEKAKFGRKRNENELLTGVYRATYAGRTLSKDIKERSQDGGIVTSLLSQFLEEGGDGVIIAGLEENEVWVPKAVVAKSREEVLRGAGTKYTPSPTMVGLKEAVKDLGLKKVAVVGTPCQMRGLARMTLGKLKNKKFADAVNLSIGLFCMETFNYDDLITYLKQNNVDTEKITKFEIKNGRFYARIGDEETFRVRLGKVKKLVRPCCEICDDFTSELADISVGNVGSPDGWSTIIVRTERGDAALKSAVEAGLIEVKPIEGFEQGEILVHRLSKVKKKLE